MGMKELFDSDICDHGAMDQTLHRRGNCIGKCRVYPVELDGKEAGDDEDQEGEVAGHHGADLNSF